MSTMPISVVTPLRIKALTLTDFRGFPGPSPATFNLDGKNLLVYGENGAGKSSVFYALSSFFSLKDGNKLRDYKNVFSGEPDTSCKVSVEFNDGTAPVEWNLRVHPASLGTQGADPRVTEAALRRACLDYRAILETNFRHGTGKINLFKVAVEHLLRDYPVTQSGGQVTTIGELWDLVLRAKPSTHTTIAITRIRQACIEFNSAFRLAFPALLPTIKELMELFGHGDVEIRGFTTPGLTYNQERLIEKRMINGQELTPELTYRAHPLLTPQTFLNEARLSALGLAIYLAGRLVCIPTAPASSLKLLVLDDVLIGLDHSNRLPVLEVLKTKFGDWQIVLLTFDRVWYEMARVYLDDQKEWKSIEVFERTDVGAAKSFPILRETYTNPTEAALRQAKVFLADSLLPAAANYTRAAFEQTLKKFCDKKSIHLPYRIDPHDVSTEDLLSAVVSWVKPSTDSAGFLAAIERVKLFRGSVLNPLSHSAPPNISRNEVLGAIASIEGLVAITGKSEKPSDPLLTSRDLIQKAAPTDEELYEALACVRGAFYDSLIRFCKNRRLRILFRTTGYDCEVLWNEVMAEQTRLFPAPHNVLPAQIDAERRWLIAPVDPASLAALTQVDLARIYNLIVTTSTMKIILETI